MTHDARPLWTLEEIGMAVGCEPGFAEIDRGLAVSGVSIDTRTLNPGDLFIAIKGPTQDGHDYVETAFEAGAAAALVMDDGKDYGAANQLCLRVGDTQAGLEDLGRAARARMQGRIVAVTGSVGKTSVKEGLRQALSACGKTHASAASYNNLWGVPLSLARMPADTEFGVFEIGMNHAGEIEPLTAQVQPDIAIVTKIAPAHMEAFATLEDVALAKSEIFSGLSGMKLAVIPRDSEWFEVLHKQAKLQGAAHVFKFGETEEADIQALKIKCHPHCSCLSASVLGQETALRVGQSGRHHALNALLVLGVVRLLDGDLTLAGLALGEMEALSGRGRKHVLETEQGDMTLIDESYNANPESMAAALVMLGQMPRMGQGRRIAVLADMKELGEESGHLHRSLAGYIESEDIDLVMTFGKDMRHLHDALPPGRIGLHASTLEKVEAVLLSDLKADDVVMLKGSNSMGLSKVVEKLCAAYRANTQSQTREVAS
ncbi:MAG: UDP-N-acetylmuramoyl-tripeptide--D-alanyl-D-alanine ligase [Parvibaculales bacterium]